MDFLFTEKPNLKRENNTEPQFLRDFKSKMDRLAEIRKNLQASVQFKEKFTNELKVRLGEINQTIIKLSGFITDLKTKATELEGQVTTNKTSIGTKEGELQQLKDQVAALTTERDNLTDQITQQNNNNLTKIAEKQKEIDEYEAKLRKLNQQKQVAEKEADEFENELSKIDPTRAEAAKTAAEQWGESFKEEQNKLLEKISTTDTKITDLEKQISDKDIELAEKQKEIDEAKGQAQKLAQDLQKEIDDLKVENQKLIGRIIAATIAINEANDELQNMVNIVPNAQTKEDVDTLLKQITDQLEKSILNISSAAQGQLPPAVSQAQEQLVSQAQQPIMPPAVPTRQPLLRSKSVNQIPKMQEKSPLLRSQTARRPDWKLGGRKTRKITKTRKAIKTRKIRKQKGGFIYKPNTKRKRIRTSQLRNVSRRYFR